MAMMRVGSRVGETEPDDGSRVPGIGNPKPINRSTRTRLPERDGALPAGRLRFAAPSSTRWTVGSSQRNNQIMADHLTAELQKIYDSEINVRISSFWDCGIEVRLGDEMNGFQAAETVKSVADILPWVQEAIAHFYPESIYAASLGADVRERAALRLFQPPRIGASVSCPHCGAPNAAPATAMEEHISFICSRCGESVKVKPPKVQ
jgi:hypothetical protein